MSNKPKAYSYIRFSTSEQAKGGSLQRQIAAAEKWCKREGVEMDTSLNLRDEGLSAYHGTHLAEGRLGAFLEAVKLGKVPKGSYLLIERIDRLSRKSIRDALKIIESILEKGIKVVTLSDDRTYTVESLNNLMELVLLLMQFSVAHEESEKKSERVGLEWQKKKEDARTKKRALSKKCPAWLRYVGGRYDGVYEVIEERAEIVREIFQRTLDGEGSQLIAKALDKKCKPWGKGKRKKGDDGPVPPSKYWHSSYITKILTDKAAIGVYFPHKLVGRKRVPDGEPIYDYYPRIVSDETFYAAQSKRRERALHGQVGRNRRSVGNLFTSVARCAGCDCWKSKPDSPKDFPTWTLKTKGRGPHGKYLGCSGYPLVCDTYLRWPYAEFERVFLEWITQIDLSQAFDEADDELAELKVKRDGYAGRLHDLDKRIKNYDKAIATSEDVDSLVTLRNGLVAERKELDGLAKAVQQELRQRETRRAEREADAAELRKLSADVRNEQSRWKLREQIVDRIQEITIFAKDRSDAEELGSRDKRAIEEYMLNYVEGFAVRFANGESRLVALHPVQPNKYLRSKAGEVRAQRWGNFEVFDCEYTHYTPQQLWAVYMEQRLSDFRGEP